MKLYGSNEECKMKKIFFTLLQIFFPAVLQIILLIFADFFPKKQSSLAEVFRIS
jgi:hypothetical protein